MSKHAADRHGAKEDHSAFGLVLETTTLGFRFKGTFRGFR